MLWWMWPCFMIYNLFTITAYLILFIRSLAYQFFAFFKLPFLLLFYHLSVVDHCKLLLLFPNCIKELFGIIILLWSCFLEKVFDWFRWKKWVFHKLNLLIYKIDLTSTYIFYSSSLFDLSSFCSVFYLKRV